MSLEKLREIQEKLELTLISIPRSKTCEHSEVPNGRVWCNYYNQPLAGRCPSCPYYKLRTKID